MRYKLYSEPNFAYETKNLVCNMLAGTSIKDTLEKTITRHGSHTRPIIEPLFQKSIALEEFFFQNIRFDFHSGSYDYKASGNKLAEFLFTDWEHQSAPILAILYYEMGLRTGLANKSAAVLGFINGDWFLQELETGNLPPQRDGAEVFKLIDGTQLSQETKYNAMKLFYDFDMYRDYARALFKHSEDLLREILPSFTNEITKHCMYLQKQIDSYGGKFFLNNAFGFEICDNQMHHIYPQMYEITSISLMGTGISDPLLLIGPHVISIMELTKNVDSNKENASAFLKCLADDTKQSILQLLKNGPMYGSQLAEKLNCSSANISHHTGALIRMGVMYVQKQNNRIYFHLNKDIVCRYLEDAKGLFA